MHLSILKLVVIGQNISQRKIKAGMSIGIQSNVQQLKKNALVVKAISILFMERSTKITR